MVNDVLFREKKIDKKSLIYLITTAVIAILVGIGFFCYLWATKIEPSLTVADCKDLECVKNYARMPSFYVGDCQNALPEFKDQCYYTYGIENPSAEESTTGDYCRPIEDSNLRGECMYQVTGITVMSEEVWEKLEKALSSLNPEDCDNIGDFEWMDQHKEQCKKDIALIQKAIDEKDVTICIDPSGDISYYARQICIRRLRGPNITYE